MTDSFDLNSMQNIGANGYINSQQKIGNNYLRATQVQSLQFQPTQEISRPFNWLTQSSFDSFQPSIYGASISESQSTLLFNTNRRAIKPAVGASDSHSNKSLDDETNEEILRLRRRFQKEQSSDQQNRFFARKQIEKKSQEEELKKQLKQKRISHVEKYRQYRYDC